MLTREMHAPGLSDRAEAGDHSSPIIPTNLYSRGLTHGADLRARLSPQAIIARAIMFDASVPPAPVATLTSGALPLNSGEHSPPFRTTLRATPS